MAGANNTILYVYIGVGTVSRYSWPQKLRPVENAAVSSDLNEPLPIREQRVSVHEAKASQQQNFSTVDSTKLVSCAGNRSGMQVLTAISAQVHDVDWVRC